MKEFTLDATGEKIGRLASRAASLLIGKHSPDFRKNIKETIRVIITNSSKADIQEKKRRQKKYDFYSGYPGGLKQLDMQTLIARKGYSEIMRKAIYGMLPSNKLRSRIIKQLIIKE